MPARTIAIRNAHPHLKIPRSSVAKIITTLDAHAKDFLGGCPTGELSLVFLTDPALAKIHADFMADPTATDVITFEGDPVAKLGGEICISADTAARYIGLLPVAALEQSDNVATLSARRLKRSYDKKRLAETRALQKSFATELTLYVVHGWLHLAGYDDLQPAKKRRMRSAEKRAMILLHDANAVPAFRLR